MSDIKEVSAVFIFPSKPITFKNHVIAGEHYLGIDKLFLFALAMRVIVLKENCHKNSLNADTFIL